MLKIAKILPVLFLALPAVLYIACSSGEYEETEYRVHYTEKTVKSDTIRRITLKDDKIKEDKFNKDSYTHIVQIGAFSIQSNFDRFLERARQVLGEEVYYEQSGNLFKVRIGRYGTRADAMKFVEIARSKGYTDAFIITRKN